LDAREEGEKGNTGMTRTETLASTSEREWVRRGNLLPLIWRGFSLQQRVGEEEGEKGEGRRSQPEPMRYRTFMLEKGGEGDSCGGGGRGGVQLMGNFDDEI